MNDHGPLCDISIKASAATQPRTDLSNLPMEKYGPTLPVHAAAKIEQHSLFHAILGRCDLQAPDEDGNSALHIASLFNWPLNLEAMLARLDAGRTTRSTESLPGDLHNKRGQNPWHFAAIAGSVSCMRVLLKASSAENGTRTGTLGVPKICCGLWTSTQDLDGQTPLSHAVRGRFNGVVQSLLPWEDVYAKSHLSSLSMLAYLFNTAASNHD